MAVVTYKRKELCSFIGKDIAMRELEEKISMLGAPVEGINESEDELSMDVTPNRLDLLGVEGMGRAVSAFLGIKKGLQEFKVEESGYSIEVDKSVKRVRPFIVGAVVKGVKVNNELIQSLMQIQEKIHETYGRKRKRVAIGIHNFDSLSPPFVYTTAKPKEVKFKPLDMNAELTLGEILEMHPKGVDYAHILKGSKRYPLVLDSKGNVASLPPIINGELTRVTESARNLFIEITGTSERAIEDTLNVLCTAFTDRGAKLYSLKVGKKVYPNLEPRKMKMSLKKMNKLLGSKFSSSEVHELLGKMGYGVKEGAKG
ncbi:MAG: phenylalanine--tRNA ligase subunit beta, partial [Candidatus Micrarchaeota archaeon]